MGDYVRSERSRLLCRQPKEKVKYLDLTARLRSDEYNEHHHDGVSILEDLNVDLVRDFTLDFLQLCCGGVDKQSFRVLTQPSQFKLSPKKIRRLDANFLSLKDCVPREFPINRGQ